jgi:excisionase family DNA binding protein
MKNDKTRVTLRIPEAARLAGVGARSIYLGVAAGAIPHIRFGRKILIPKAAFLRWIESGGQERVLERA